MKSPKPLGSLLRSTLREYGLAQKSDAYEIILAWPAIVGERVAAETVAERLDHGTLVVKVSSPVWRYELQMRKREILSRVQESFGTSQVSDIQWR